MRDDDGLNPSKPEILRLKFRTSSELYYVFWSLSREENNINFLNKLLIQEDLAQIRKKTMIKQRTEIRVNSKSMK